jgi:cytochrome c553
MHTLKVFMTLCFLTVSVYSQDLEQGAKLYKKCITCHGKDGMGKKSQKAPMIAGQYDWYIVSQIESIISKKRFNNNAKKMYPFVKNLSDKEIKDLAAYISTLPKR